MAFMSCGVERKRASPQVREGMELGTGLTSPWPGVLRQKDRSSRVETFEASWSQGVVEVARKRVRQCFEERKKQDPKAKL